MFLTSLSHISTQTYRHLISEISKIISKMRKIKNKIDSSESLSIFLIKKIKLLKRLFKNFYFSRNEFTRENVFGWERAFQGYWWFVDEFTTLLKVVVNIFVIIARLDFT